MINEDKALKLLNEVSLYKCENVDTAPHKDLCVAFRRAIEQHEAFRQEVSDTIQAMLAKDGAVIRNYLDQFIIPAPKPDLLVEVIEAARIDPKMVSTQDYADAIRAALDKLGFEIREKNDG